MPLSHILWVGLGGFIGSVLRYGVSHLVQVNVTTTFPLGTLLINLAGCFLIGIILGFTMSHPGGISQSGKLFLTTGICGGFTTFSAFSVETFSMLEKGEPVYAGIYVLASVLGGVVTTLAGMHLAR